MSELNLAMASALLSSEVGEHGIAFVVSLDENRARGWKVWRVLEMTGCA